MGVTGIEPVPLQAAVLQTVVAKTNIHLTPNCADGELQYLDLMINSHLLCP